MNLLIPILLLTSALPTGRLMAQESSILIDHFGGLDDSQTPAVINKFDSQSLMNVESNLTGTAVMGRKGYLQQAALTVATAPVSGGYHFIDPNGNQQVIVCHNVYCAKSTNNGTF